MCVCVCVCVCVTLASVRCNSTRESWTKLKLGIWICHSEKVCPIVFGGGQRSCGVTRGQRPKTLFARYLKVGSLDKFHTWYVDALWREDECCSFWWRSKVIWGHQQSNTENLLLKQYLKIHHSEKLCHTVLGGGQRSSGVTKGQKLISLVVSIISQGRKLG
ncbi:hypothetical protein HOLleu_43824 [Holothuria leucospilota]|uniref:Secreted protein n=1 Tax=Holothuria leucospilota TaxID=206669 RepID=A0A9Q0YBI0_HOLLE|nr:hypothetical protein HOLleu_43824 [Holothuria leucospilota]